jgi:hypothetical protein
MSELSMLAVDERCGMELDETDPTIWLKLEAATDEYIQKNFLSVKNLCELLVPRYQEEEKSSDIYKSLSFSRLTSLNQGLSFPKPAIFLKNKYVQNLVDMFFILP